jgi:YD repeat-containing protein
MSKWALARAHLLTDPDLRAVNAQPDLAHLSSTRCAGTRNSHWTHTWAQYLEVVADDAGEIQAIWNTGGGSVGFQWNADQTWTARDSFHRLRMGGVTEHIATGPSVIVGGNGCAAGGEAGGANACMVSERKVTPRRIVLPYGWFEATDAAGTIYRFEGVYWEDGTGVAISYFPLKRVTDRWGRVVNLTWEFGYLQSVRDGDGRGLDFHYTGGMLTSITDAQNRTHTLGYTQVPSGGGNQFDKLAAVQVLGPGSPDRVVYTWLFDYGTAADAASYGGTYTGDLIIRKREPSGKWVNYEYAPVNTARTGYDDWDGRVTRCWYADAAEGGRVKAITRSGSTLTYPGGASVTYGYQGHDLVSVRADNSGREARYTYDAWHNRTSVRTNREPEGSPASSS